MCKLFFRLFALLAVAYSSIQPANAEKVILDPELGNASSRVDRRRRME